ncbi:beta-lactamase class A [Deinobacterium chartae]|uniref:Beta-lactamase class A n=1 Tax=Deinobacterium chartae TaxID=521158 RepID=A0A841I0P0_9DEIO|nr:serine hydrolase [Deinobacterium chartae]MBB6098544.1 beta-lactamase class A [Deinobacterium chartae]
MIKSALWLATGALLIGSAWFLTRPLSPHAASVQAQRAEAEAAEPACLRRDPATPTLEAPEPPAGLGGRLGLYVAVFDPVTLRPLRAVVQDPDGQYPLASSYKQAVLYALMEQVQSGKVELSERFDVSEADRSLGAYPYDGSNVVTLAERMIHNSDNTATDILHRRVGLEAVQDVADRLKLCHTRLLLPTKTWWTAQAGWGGPDFPQEDLLHAAERYATAPREQQLALARRLDERARESNADRLSRALDRYFESDRYDPRIDLNTQNASTPFEFAQLIAHEFLAPGLEEPQRQLFNRIMRLGFGQQLLEEKSLVFGGKGGNGWRILTMTGYYQNARGEHVVYVFMNHESPQVYTLPETRRAFRWINAAARRLAEIPPVQQSPAPPLSAPDAP